MPNTTWISTSWLKEKAKEYEHRPFFSRSSTHSKTLITDIKKIDAEVVEQQLHQKIFSYLENPANKKRRLYNLLFPHRDQIRELNEQYRLKFQATQSRTLIEETQNTASSLKENITKYVEFSHQILKTMEELKQIKRQLTDQIEEVVNDSNLVASKRYNTSQIHTFHTNAQAENKLKLPALPVPMKLEESLKGEEQAAPLLPPTLVLDQLKGAINLYRLQTENLSFLRKVFTFCSRASKDLVTAMQASNDENALLELTHQYMDNPSNKNKRLYKILQDVHIKAAKEIYTQSKQLDLIPIKANELPEKDPEIVKLEANLGVMESRCTQLINEAQKLHSAASALQEELDQKRSGLLNSMKIK